MRFVLKSLSKYPARSMIYAFLLTTSFATTTILINTFLTAQTLLKHFDILPNSFENYEERLAYWELFQIRDAIYVSMSSLIPAAMLIILLCVLILPFLQYLFSIGRGYEIGILRALGMSKVRAWFKLFLENVIILAASLAMTQIIALIFHKLFTLSLLSIDTEMMDTMTETFADISESFSFNWNASLYALGSAVVITFITAGLCNILISSNAPLKLIRNYK
jgi:hypothetical protein